MKAKKILVQTSRSTYLSSVLYLGTPKVKVTLTFYPNKAADGWMMDIETAYGKTVGISLVAGIDLFRQYRYLNLPNGYLFCYGLDPGVESFKEDETILVFADA